MLAALARETEIDYPELVQHVNAVLAGASSASVGDVLDAHPASQGVASVVGLLSLATRYGEVREEEIEQLAWQGVDGIDRRADVRRHLFTQEVDA